MHIEINKAFQATRITDNGLILVVLEILASFAMLFADANDIASIVNDAVGADELAIFQVKSGQKLEIHVSEVVLVGDTDVKPTRILSGKDIN